MQLSAAGGDTVATDMGTSLSAQKLAAWVNHQVEKEGIAKLTIIILLLTTVGMLSFTWGYAEVR